ncbi:MAG: hypothetical protein U0V04_01165 [Spirosomataceae bacterium]|jgi:hypothetical protein|nr:hypothetical protein [Bacteroidota bacterium]
MKLFDSLLLFGSLGLLIIWSDQVIYKNAGFKDSYFLLMFGLGGFLYYVYRRGIKKLNEKDKDKKKK